MARRRLVLLTGLAAAVPTIVSTLHAIVVGWMPLGDEAVIVARSYDVFTTHTPLLGQFSASSGVLGQPTHSLGPLQYWLLAVPARLGIAWAPAVATGLVNTAAVMGTVALAHRRGGRALMFTLAAALPLALASLAQETYHSVWNPSAALLPFTLLIFVAWSLACGEHRLLPLAAVLASFVVQCHLTYVLPTLGLLAIGLSGLALARRGEWRAVRGWAIAALAGLLVCWSAPLVEEAIHRPGNLELVARSSLSGEPRLGAGAGWHAVVRAVGVPPWWARSPQQGLSRLADVVEAPPPASTASALVLVVGLGAAAVVALRRRRREVAWGAMIALVLCVALALVAASTPSSGILFISVAYTLRWGSFAGMFTWVVLAWSAASLLLPERRLAKLGGQALAAGTGIVVVAVAGGVVAASGDSDRLEPAYKPLRRAVDRLAVALRADRAVSVTAPKTADLAGFDIPAGIVTGLRRAGIAVQAPTMHHLFGSYYAPGTHPYDDLIRVEVAGRPPPQGARVIGRVGSRGTTRPVTIVVVPSRVGA